MESIFVLLLFSVIFLKITYVHSTENCVAVAEQSAGLMGGWTKHDISKEDSTFRGIVLYFTQMALNDLNKKSNDIRYYKLHKNKDDGFRIKNVFTQVVAGTNYCIEFEAKAAGCKGANQADFCTDGVQKCSFKGYQPIFLLQGSPEEPSISDIVCSEEKSSKDPKAYPM